ncbi:cytochrome c biogenesis CcdA family protein [Anaeromicropila populeti]|uniref:Cytochrome c-type biogenesis protein n=1 Tax=Anaeromicropila populeti TaxID=37658 RepID=A0A1I6HI05_9FIRM|nr:cytochrome c biogenesis protein CcdA [Anaeromicropila populeti]SFR54112.1 cytochrome c-type biogenesis protein [Anaeromicropila populeti]
MQYIISFLEGIITFISPCLLPMLPIYISYFAGGSQDKRKVITNALGFILGFTVVFVSLGAFAGSLGHLLKEQKLLVNIVTGGIVILFGLNFTGIFKIGFLNSTRKLQYSRNKLGFGAAVIFGIIFSIGWTPCVGAFLGSALMLASERGSMVQGIFMLIAYSVGLGIPFLMSAILIDKLKGTFQFIKTHYQVINIISGIFLILVGIAMMTGYMGYLLSLLSF